MIMGAENSDVVRIVFVESYPHVIFGQQKKKLALLDTERARSLSVTVAVPGSGVFVDEVKSKGVPILYLEYPSRLSVYGKAHKSESIWGKFKLFWLVLKYVFLIRKQVRLGGFDVVMCDDLRGVLTFGLAARTLGLPVVYWDNTDEPNGVYDVIATFIVTDYIFLSEAVRCKYPRMLRRFMSTVRDAPKIPTGVSLEKFDRGNSIRSELGFEKKDIVFAIIGSITYRKGHDRIFSLFHELVKKLPMAKLLVVGETNSTQNDEQFNSLLLNQNHPNIIFTGYRADIENIMHTIDVLLVPSRHEGQGQVVTQAMACRKPVIGSKVGGIQEAIVDGGTGVLIDGDDGDGWFNAMLSLGSNPSLCDRMGLAGRHRVEQLYEWGSETGRLFDVIEAAARVVKPC